MFEKILIAGPGDQLLSGSAVAQPDCPAAESRKRHYTAETRHV
jgi:hypothetical protein